MDRVRGRLRGWRPRGQRTSRKVIWQSDERCVVEGVTFQIPPVGILNQDQPHVQMEGADFLLLKPRVLVDRYAQILAELRPRNIFELGVFGGGSTALLAELADPRVLVGIDKEPLDLPDLRNYIERKDHRGDVRILGEVDQADRGRLAEIAHEAFGGQPLDLVVDDCSHQYEPTRASFNELFPRLRPGGLYTIEDWAWGREQQLVEMWADAVPLTRLGLELVLLLASGSGAISEITMETELIEITRGDAHIDPHNFDILNALGESARGLLARE